MISTKQFIVTIMFMCLFVNVSNASSFSDGFMYGTITNSIDKSVRKNVEPPQPVEKFRYCMTNIQNDPLSETTHVREKCVIVYEEPKPSLLSMILFLFCILSWVCFCINADDDQRADACQFVAGMMVADIVDSMFNSDD